MRRATRSALVLFLLIASAGSATVLAGKRYESEQRFEASLVPARVLEIHNLLGSVEIRPTPETDVARVMLRVVAEAKTPELARKLGESIRLQNDTTDVGTVLRVDFPTVHSRFSTPRSESGNLLARWVGKWLDKSTLTVPYGDRNVEVGSGKDAALVTAHLTIDLPIDVACKIDQVAGSVEVHDWRGDVELAVVEGHIAVDRLFGTLRARTTGGSVTIQDFQGDFVEVRTGSGGATLQSIRAQRVELHTTSGDVDVQDLRSDVATVSGGSGGLRLENVESASLAVNSDAGDVLLASLLDKMRNATIEAPDSEVTLQLGRAPYDLLAETPDGALETGTVDVSRVGDEGGAAHLRQGPAGGADLRVVARKLVMKPQDAGIKERSSAGRLR